MPTQSNFRTDVTNNKEIRYTASRIVSVGDEFILLEEIPASFGFDIDDVVEIHFYTIPENQLILSTVIDLTDDIIKSHIVSYADDTFKNYVRIDFTKLFINKNLILAPSDYRMVLNFLSNEIGSYDNRILSLQVISDSRTEAQLVFNNTVDDAVKEQNLKLLKEFVEPSLNKPDTIGAMEKIFTSGITTDDINEGITSALIAQSFPTDVVQRMTTLGVYDVFKTQIDNFLLELFTFVREEIIIKGDERLQFDEIQQIIINTVVSKITELQRIVDSRIKVS